MTRILSGRVTRARAARVLALAAAAAVGRVACAQTWDSGGGDNNWGTANNWDTNLAPANNGTANIAFGFGARTTPVINTPWDVNTVTFLGGAPSFTNSGSQLTLRGVVTNSSGTGQTFTNPILLGASLGFVANTGGLTFGQVNFGTNTLTVSGANNLNIATAIGGVGSLVKTGAGNLTLGTGAADTTANTYTGLTTVSAGTLTLDKATNAASIVGDLLITGGTVNANRAGQFGNNVNVTLNGGTFNAGASTTFASFTVFGGGLGTANFTLTGSGTSSLTMGGGLGIGGAINLTGASGGGVAFVANNGAGSTLSGTLNLGNVNRNFTIADGPAADDFTLASQITNGGVTKVGPGTLALTATNNAYTGGTTINAGTLRITSDGSLGNAAAGLTFNGGTLLTSNSVNSARPVSLGAGGGTIDTGANSLTLAGALSGAGAVTKVGGGTLTLGGGAADLSPNVANGTLTINAGNVVLDKGPGTVAFAGDVVINAGSLITNRAGELATTSNVTQNNGGLFLAPGSTFGTYTAIDGTGGSGSMVLTSTAPYAYNLGPFLGMPFDVTLSGASGGGIRLTAGVAGLTTHYGAIDLGAHTRSVQVADNVAGDDLIITGIVSNGSVQKDGPGTLALLGHNTYAGQTTINAGTLRIQADDGLGVGGNVLLSGGTLQTSDTFTLQHPLTSNLGFLSTDANTTLTVPTISGTYLYKDGPGTLLLNGAGGALNGWIDARAGTLAIGNDTAVGPGAIYLSEGGALFGSGAPRTLANTLIVYPGGGTLGGTDLTFTSPASVQSTAPLSINAGTTATFNAGIARGSNEALTKDGLGTMVLAGGTTSVPITVNKGSLVLAGTSLTAPLTNYGSLTYNSGAVTTRITNFGDFQITQNLTAGNGVANYGTMSLPNVTFLSNGAGLDNEGALTLSNSIIGGSPLITNGGQITGYGAIIGNNGFISSGLITPTQSLSVNTAFTNSGQVTVNTGAQLAFFAPPVNTGTITLNGGQIGGSFGLLNLPGGVITGKGTLFSVNNAGGNIVLTDGNLNIQFNGWGNSGSVQLGGLTASLNGGSVNNQGTVQGFGTVGSVVNNQSSGTIEAVGGTLNVAAANNTNAGLLAASTGNKLLFSSGLSTNAGTINLAGGTFDNGGHPLNNTGQISGFGILRTGGLTNNGSITLTGGSTTINGDVANAAGHKIEVRFSPALFTGNVVNNGTFKNTGASVTFAGTYTEAGTFISDPADNYFSTINITGPGALVGGSGDRFFVTGDLLNGSTSPNWDTAAAALLFSGSPSHLLTTPAADLGASYAGYAGNFAWGAVQLAAGESLTLADADTTPGGALYLGDLQLAGGLSQLPLLSAPAGITIYYDPARPANAYLAAETYTLSGGGALAPVPEPSGLALLGIGGTALLARRRRRR